MNKTQHTAIGLALKNALRSLGNDLKLTPYQKTRLAATFAHPIARVFLADNPSFDYSWWMRLVLGEPHANDNL